MINKLYKRIVIFIRSAQQYLQRYIIKLNSMIAEEEGYAIYLDDSGSVSGSQNYWDTVVEILNLYGKDIKHYYYWNSIVIDADKKAFEKSIAGKVGRGGNELRYVAESVVQHRHHNVIMVTDGEVADYSVKETDDVFEKNAETFKMKKAICYIVSSWNNKLNMSVTCAFTRSCESKVFTKENSLSPMKTIASYTPEDFKILDELEEISLENLEAKYELIESLIIAQNMGKSGNIPLKNQIVTMKNRIVKELSKKMNKEKDYAELIRESLAKKDFASAIEVARQMTNAYFSDSDTTDIEKKISHLINLCGDLRGKYNIDQIKSNKMSTALNAVNAKPDLAVEVADLSQNPIECPIIMDEDVPQILIDECEPLLLGVDKGVVDDIAACPLRILNYPEIKQKLKSRLSNYVGVKFTDKFHKNPFTQNRLLGAIPLGTHSSHVKAGNYTLAKMISGGKILGNLNMYYAAIWLIIHEGEIEYLKDIEKNATEHLLFRLRNSKTMVSLCGQAQFVTTELPSDVAVWYCVNSGYLNQPTNRDTFRFHFFNINPLIKITNVLEYPNGEGLEEHCKRTKAMLTLLSKVKKINTMEKKALKAIFTGLYQNGIFTNLEGLSEKFKELEVCPPFIPVDGEATPAQIEKILQLLPESLRSLPLEQIYHISQIVDASKSASDIFLDYNLKVNPLPKAEINWCYGLDHYPTVVNICPKTLRPYYNVEGGTWVDSAKKSFKVDDVNKLFKGCKYIEQYIIKYKKRPVANELILFYYNRYVEAGSYKTLPYQAEAWTHELLAKYEVAFPEGYDIEKIVELLEKSRCIEVREQLEVGKDVVVEKKVKKSKKDKLEQKTEETIPTKTEIIEEVKPIEVKPIEEEKVEAKEKGEIQENALKTE